MPSKPQFSKIFAFVGGLFPYYHLDGTKCKISFKTSKNLSMISIGFISALATLFAMREGGDHHGLAMDLIHLQTLSMVGREVLLDPW